MNVRLTLLVLAAAFALPAQAEMYKWVDQDGNVIYSQTPPPDGSEVRKIAPPPKVPAPVAKPEKADADAVASKEGAGAPDLKAEAKAKEAALKDEMETRKKNCEVAKHNLDVYQNFRRIRGPDGEAMVIEDEERAAKVKESEAKIKEFCK